MNSMRKLYSRREAHHSSRLIATSVLLLLLQSFLVTPVAASPAPPKLKLRGYITGRIDDSTVAILDDHIQMSKRGKVEFADTTKAPRITFADLVMGQLVEAEGIWEGKHQFLADWISVEPGLVDKSVHESAYLQGEPEEAYKIAVGEPAVLKADGELLTIGVKTHRDWHADNAASATPIRYAGRQVHYSGVRREDGRIETEKIELDEPAPPEAYNMPHNIEVVRSKDPQSHIDILDFRRGDKVDGRLKLLEVPEVQKYVADLGNSLLPAGGFGTTRGLEFRFFVVEDPNINAQALPDGTILVNTGLLGAVDNEAELAFALSHEISHVLQAHMWREANETRAAKVAIFIAGVAATYYVGDLSLFLSGLGMKAVANGHQRALENQADRLGLQTIIDRGYDPRQASKLLETLIDRYGDRSTSILWSNHDSSVLRGSFLAVQIQMQYPEGKFEGARVDTPAFQAMRDAMGPVKIN